MPNTPQVEVPGRTTRHQCCRPSRIPGQGSQAATRLQVPVRVLACDSESTVELMISADVDFDTVVEGVEAKQCEWKPDGVNQCENIAEFMVWGAHTGHSCPGSFYACEHHLNRAVLLVRRAMFYAFTTMTGGYCNRCGEVPRSSKISDFIRWIEL